MHQHVCSEALLEPFCIEASAQQKGHMDKTNDLLYHKQDLIILQACRPLLGN